MPSKKHYAKMSKYGEENYAPRPRKLEKNNFKKHSDGSKSWSPSQTSDSHSLFQSGQVEQEEREIDDEIRPKDANPTESSPGDGEVPEILMAMCDLPKRGAKSRRKTGSNKKPGKRLQDEKSRMKNK